MIDEVLTGMVRLAKATLDSMPDAKPSERQAVREEFAGKATKLVGEALLGMPEAHKIAFFNDMAKGRIVNVVARIEALAKGEPDPFENDSDLDGELVEEAYQATFGPTVYDALNALPALMKD